MRMSKVAVFGNAGGGKSTLARGLAEITGLPLHVIDMIQFQGRYRPGEKNGGKIPHEDYLKIHADLISRDRWIIDGFESVALAWERFAAADTLVYVDLPVLTHYRFVTQRFLKGLFRNPPGWPENSPVWSSTLDSYRVIGRCHRLLTPKYRQYVTEASASKRVHHLKSPEEMQGFLAAVREDMRSVS